MKKSLLCLAVAAIMLGFCACGGQAEVPSSGPSLSEPAETSGIHVTPLPMPVPKSETAEAPATETPAEEDAAFELAKGLIGADVQELYDQLGEPLSSDYSSSCMGPGEDGELHYEGFTVYTYREGEQETVHDVLDEG